MKATAIAIVKMGALARIGALMLSGRRETALNVKIQLDVTIAALTRSIRCSESASDGIFPKKNTGKRMAVQVMLTRKEPAEPRFR